MWFDELDGFIHGFRTRHFAHSEPKAAQEEEDIIDELLDLYLTAFYEGSKQAAEELLIDIKPDVQDAQRAIWKKIDGKDFSDRVREYLKGEMGETKGTPEEAILRVAETDYVRIFNEGGLSTAKRGGASTKTWNTMEDMKVRDTHAILEGAQAPIDGYFYTYTGERALAPGQFGSAAEDCGCRCFLTFSK